MDGRAKQTKGNWFLNEIIELLDQPLPRPFYLWNSSYVHNKLPYCLKLGEPASLLLALETILTDRTTLSWVLDVTTGCYFSIFFVGHSCPFNLLMSIILQT